MSLNKGLFPPHFPDQRFPFFIISFRLFLVFCFVLKAEIHVITVILLSKERAMMLLLRTCEEVLRQVSVR